MIDGQHIGISKAIPIPSRYTYEQSRQGGRLTEVMRMTFHKIVIIAIGLLLSFNVAGSYPGGPDTTLLSEVCNGQQYPEDDGLYDDAMGDVELKLVSQTPIRGYDYYVTSSRPEDIVYGHAACNGKLAVMACNACLNIAYDQLSRDCPPRSVGAQVQLQDCRVRYEIYPFIE